MFVGELSDFRKQVQAEVKAAERLLESHAAARSLETPSAPARARSCEGGETPGETATARETTVASSGLSGPRAARTRSGAALATPTRASGEPRPRAKRKLLAEQQ